MENKYRNKYRIPSSRADWWDYSSRGAYFVTICTANRYPYFGYMADGIMEQQRIQNEYNFFLMVIFVYKCRP